MKWLVNLKLSNRTARHPEEPCAGEPHAGICEGGSQQWVSLP